MKLLQIKNRKSLIKSMVVPLSFVCALMVGAIMLLLEGENPFEIYKYLFIQPLSSWNGILKVLARVTPLIFAGLAVMVAFKCKVFNIGVEGQLYIGGLAAAILGYYCKGLPSILHILVCVTGAMAAGALYAWIPAFLKVKLNVHEVISTIMLNYIATGLIAMYVINFFRYEGPVARTPDISSTSRLMQFRPSEQLNIGIFLALILCVALHFILKKTPIGWRIEAAGKNIEATMYSGVNAGKLMIITMMCSGAIAALVGVERVLGAYGYMEVGFSPGYGWDGITIAIIAGNNPFGVLVMAGLLGLMSYGGNLISINSGVPSEWVSILSALIFIFVVLGNAILKIWEKRTVKVTHKGGGGE